MKFKLTWKQGFEINMTDKLLLSIAGIITSSIRYHHFATFVGNIMAEVFKHKF